MAQVMRMTTEEIDAWRRENMERPRGKWNEMKSKRFVEDEARAHVKSGIPTHDATSWRK